jgi:HlyD family secretion protein
MTKHNQPSLEDMQSALGLSTKARSRKKLRRYFWLASLLLAVGGVSYWYYAQSQTTQKVTYTTLPASTNDLVVMITATGTVQPTTQVDVGTELSGTVKTVEVADNSIVKKGDVLATLDVVRLTAERARAAAQLAAARARLIDAQSTATQTALAQLRQKKLRISGLSTDQELESSTAAEARAMAALAVVEADIQSSMADLSIVETDLAKSQILSPIDGIVLKTSVKPGQTVAASLQAPVLFTLADNLANIQIDAAVDEADIGLVKQGQKASFSVDAFRNRDFKAEVGVISFSPDKLDGVVTYKTILAAQNADLALRPGMTATARIIVNEAKSALVVANETLRYVPAAVKPREGFSITQIFMPRFPRNEKVAKPSISTDGTHSLWVLRDNKPVEIKVKTTLSDGKQTQIESADLKAGDDVIVSARSN